MMRYTGKIMMLDIEIIKLFTMYIIAIIYMIILLYVTLRYFIFPKAVLELSQNNTVKRLKLNLHKTELKKLPKTTQKKIDEINKMYKQVYDYTRSIDKVPTKYTRLTCIILKENKFAKILYFSGERTSFRYEKSLYFITSSHSCDNNAKILVYLEGVSLPVSCENLEKQTITKEYIELDGSKKTTEITVIKGLRWDGKILHQFVNQKFAEIFTKVTVDMIPILCLIIGIVTCILAGISIGSSYIFR